MLDRESIKNVIESGGTIQFPYKRNLKSWYGECSISKSANKEYYIRGGGPASTFRDADLCIDFFISMLISPDNAAYVIERLSKEGIWCDLEDPDDEYIKKFKKEKKVVAKELKELNLHIIKIGTDEEIELAIDNIKEKNKESVSPEDLVYILDEFKYRFTLNDPYISIHFVYNQNASHTFSISIPLCEFNNKRIADAKDPNEIDAKFSYSHTQLMIGYYSKNGGERILKIIEL
jgi:hypothetical protein